MILDSPSSSDADASFFFCCRGTNDADDEAKTRAIAAIKRAEMACLGSKEMTTTGGNGGGGGGRNCE